jgi:hypothetical protein
MWGKERLEVPRRCVRAVRWAECVFVLVSTFMLLSLPFPPPRDTLGSVAVLGVGCVWAGLVWWGLRSPTRFGWWAGLALAVVWSLSSFRLLAGWVRMLVGILDGYDLQHGYGLATLFSTSVAALPPPVPTASYTTNGVGHDRSECHPLRREFQRYGRELVRIQVEDVVNVAIQDNHFRAVLGSRKSIHHAREMRQLLGGS